MYAAWYYIASRYTEVLGCLLQPLSLKISYERMKAKFEYIVTGAKIRIVDVINLQIEPDTPSGSYLCSLRVLCVSKNSLLLAVLTIQSRVGPVEWLKPYTDTTIRELGKSGVKSLLAVPVRFVDNFLQTFMQSLLW